LPQLSPRVACTDAWVLMRGCLLAWFVCAHVDGVVCLDASPNPGYGVRNFDTFPWAIINVFIVTSVANWTDIMYPLWDTLSSFVFLYFVSLILIGAYFAVNLALVR
jgi:hypothetical protein